MDGIRSKPVPTDPLEKSLLAAEGLQMTRAAWQRGVTNMLLCMVFVYAICITMAVGVSFYFGMGRVLSIGVAFVAFWIVTFAAFLIIQYTLNDNANTTNAIATQPSLPTRNAIPITMNIAA